MDLRLAGVPSSALFLFYSVTPLVCLFVFVLMLLIGSFPFENMLFLCLTLTLLSAQCPIYRTYFHPNSVLSLSRFFLFCAPFPAVSSTLFSFVLFFMHFLHFPTPRLQWGVFPFHILYIHFFSFLLPWYSFSCLTVRVQFDCLIWYLFTGFSEQALWLLCRAWLLLDPPGRFIPGLGL